MTVKILTPLEKSQVLAAYHTGSSKADIALEFEVSHKTINRVLIEKGAIKKAWRSEIRLTKDEAELIWEMRENGTKPKDVMTFPNLRVFDVFRWFRKQSITRQKMLARMIAAELKTKVTKKSA